MEVQKLEKDWVLLNFLDFEKSLNGGASLPLHAKRKEAFSKYSTIGFPTVKDEEWRYTNPLPIKEAGFRIVKSSDASKDLSSFKDLETPNLDSHKIFIVDGTPVIESQLVDPGGLSVYSISGSKDFSELGTIASSEEQFVAINTSFLQDGVVITVAKNTKLDRPLELIWVTTDKAAEALLCPRVFVKVETGAHCQIVERFISKSKSRYFNNSVFECAVGENAFFDHYRVQEEALQAYHVSTISIKAASNARVRTHTFSFGAKLVRNNVAIVMEGSGCDVTMNGLSALTGAQHVDNNTLLDHAKPHCQSHELYKGIYGDSSQGVFSGSIIVRPDAQKTSAIQSNRSLLLTPQAQINTKPQLKIWADDVKCTHGATIGQLDDDALFYIRSRGTSEADARVMLIHAFASEVISEVAIAPLRANLAALLLEKLHLKQL